MRKAVCPEELTHHSRDRRSLVTDNSNAPFSVLHGRLCQNFIGIFKLLRHISGLALYQSSLTPPQPLTLSVSNPNHRGPLTLVSSLCPRPLRQQPPTGSTEGGKNGAQEGVASPGPG